MTEYERARWSNPNYGSALWTEDMLSYCCNLLSQIRDYSATALKDDDRGFVVLPATVGPDDNPDEYDISSLLAEIRKRRPLY